jgi:hypothetical protein
MHMQRGCLRTLLAGHAGPPAAEKHGACKAAIETCTTDAALHASMLLSFE